MYVYIHVGVTGAQAGHLQMRTLALLCQAAGLSSSSSFYTWTTQKFSQQENIQLMISSTRYGRFFPRSWRIISGTTSLTYKGRLSFIQYMPKKPHKWGLKAWVLADSTNGYCWNWKLYTGKEGDRTQHGLAHAVVMDLVNHHDLAQMGYIVFTDNFYSSPALFKDLSDHGFGACGTARKDRRGIP